MIRFALLLMLVSFGLIAQDSEKPAEQKSDFTIHLMPKETNIVVCVDMKQIRESNYFDVEMKKSFEAINNVEQIKQLVSVLEFDPNKDINQLIFCGNGRGPERDDTGLVILKGSFKRETLAPALAKRAEDGELTALSAQDTPFYFNHNLREAVFFSIIDDSTVICAGKRKAIEEAISGVGELRQPSKEIMDRLATEQDMPSPAFIMAEIIPEEAKAAMARNPQLAAFAQKMLGYKFIGRFGETNTFTGAINFSDAESAKATAGTIKFFMGLGKMQMAALPEKEKRPDLMKMMDTIKIEPVDSDITFAVEMTPDTLREIIANNRKDDEVNGPERRRRFEERRKAARERREKGERPEEKKDGDRPAPGIRVEVKGPGN